MNISNLFGTGNLLHALQPSSMGREDVYYAIYPHTTISDSN